MNDEIRVVENNCIYYLDSKGRFHRGHGPAIIRNDGSFEYRRHGELHRKRGPALRSSIGEREYWFRGKRHSLNGRAEIRVYRKDSKFWVDGVECESKDSYEDLRNKYIQEHPEEDPDPIGDDYDQSLLLAQDLSKDGSVLDCLFSRRNYDEGENILFYVWRDSQGISHREDGPAVIYKGDGRLVWKQHGRCHRLDGPAIIHASGAGAGSFYIDGRYVGSEFNQHVQQCAEEYKKGNFHSYLEEFHKKLRNKK